MRFLLPTLLFSLIITATTGLAADWVKLGNRHVTDRTDRDTLNVGVKRGRFEAVRLGAKGRAIQFHDVKIHFENGDVQDVQLRNVVRAGEWTRAIDLNGGKRRIDKIVMRYDAQTARRRKGATVLVRGRR
jgi:hypothetical protein